MPTKTAYLSRALISTLYMSAIAQCLGSGLQWAHHRSLRLHAGNNVQEFNENGSDWPAEEAHDPAEEHISSSSNTQEGKKMMYVLLAVLMVVSFVVLVCFILACKVLTKQDHPKEEDIIHEGESETVPRLFNIKGVGSLKVFGHCIGRGSYGVVWQGKLLGQDGLDLVKQVAVKEIRNQPCLLDLPGAPEFERNREARILKSCKHKNIVKCYGSILTHDEYGSSTVIILEWLPFTLSKLIHDDDDFASTCTYKDLLEIFIGIAAGLKYLHEDKRVIHFDLNPRNVLMETKSCPKLSDFGVSKIQSDGSVIVSGVRGTKPYIAPEVNYFADAGQGKHKVNQSVDTYSFGVLMWECTMRQKLSHVGLSRFEDPNGVTMYGKDGQKTYKCSCPEPLKTLIQRCLRFDEILAHYNVVTESTSSRNYKRPSTHDILSKLTSMLEEPWIDDMPLAWIQH